MKTKFKKQWTQAVAVAAAAVCAVTATCSGVTINHAAPMEVYALEAGDEVKVTVVDDTDDSGNPTRNFEIAASQFSATDVGKTVYLTFETSTEYAGDSFKGGGGYWDNAASEWIPFDAWQGVVEEDGTIVIGVEVLEGMLTYDGVVQMHGIIPAEGGWENAGGTLLTFIAAAFEQPYSEETTTTTTTTTTESSEEVTTTTTTDTTESSEDTTTTTTVTESSDSSEDTTTTTTTTESTTKATTTTTTTTPKATTTTTTTSVTLETKISFSQEKDDDGNPCVKIDTLGADYVTVVMKVLTSDTQATLAYQGMYDGTWDDDKYEALSVGTDKLVVHTYRMRENLDDNALTIASYWPTSVSFQSITLGYDEAPVVTTTTEFESDLTFETVTVHEKETHKIDMLDRCYIIETIKADPGYTISGGMYSGTEKDTYYTSDSWKETVGESQIIVKEYDIRGAYDASYGIFYYGKGTEKRTSVEVNIQTFYTGDASMNGKVNGSDVRAIVNYIVSGEETNAQNVICDYDYDGKVALADAVTLTKALLGSYTTQALNS